MHHEPHPFHKLSRNIVAKNVEESKRVELNSWEIT
jgi:hypothetical protein